jgi:signal peptidase I
MRIKKILKYIRDGIDLLFIIAILAIMMKVFLFANFSIPSWSMNPAIMAGDHIIVNKLVLGPRLYENFGFLNGKKTKMKRFAGLRSVRRNDVLVFDYPYQTSGRIEQGGNVFYVKRCVAVAGDTFYIENGIYRVKGVIEELGNMERQRALSGNDGAKTKEYVFPHDTVHFRWTIRDFGPLFVPSKGSDIQTDSISVQLYKNLIEYETGKTVSVGNGIVFLGDSAIRNYTFRQDYYFMAGDNVQDSRDSRYWGLLPDDLILGKAVLIFNSKDPHTGKRRRDRFLKIIK